MIGGGMRALRWLVALLACCLVAAFIGSASGSQATDSRPLVALLPSAGLEGDPLVLEDAEPLLGGEQVASQREARRMLPSAIGAREASRTQFERLTGARAAQLAAKAFPDLVRRQAGAPPLARGERIIGYPSTHSASLLLPGGRHGVVESAEPLATEVSRRKRVPLHLAVHPVAGGFEPSAAQVQVHIPGRLAEGISLPSLGVSLTPLGKQGSPAAGASGQVDGAAVFYGNTGSDTDTIVKPTPSGFEEDTVLRSVDSPQQLAFRVGLPRGARLARENDGVVQVELHGTAIATIPAPSALDAEGVNVPVTVRVAGNRLNLTVAHRGAPSAYRYPIEVDPWITDKQVFMGGQLNNWISYTTNPAAFKFNEREINDIERAEYGAGEYARDIYNTQKESHIYAFYVKNYTANTYGPTETIIRIASPSAGTEGKQPLANWGSGEKGVCAEGTCEARPVTGTNKENTAFFEVGAIEKSKEYFSSTFYEPSVYIDQDKGPVASTDTSDQTLNGAPNAGTGQWVSATSEPAAVLGVQAFDPGVGVDAVGTKSPNKVGWGHAPEESRENECAGYYEKGVSNRVQCNECYENTCAATGAHGKPLGVELAKLSELPEGEDTVEATVQDAVGLSAIAKGTIHVDDAAPTGVTLTGLPSELASGEFHLKAEATDARSGIKSIALLIDGAQVGTAAGACEGACTAKNEWTITGRTYAVGTHTATVIATDKAGNVSNTTVTFKVNQTSKTSVGPGAVNLASGEFSLSATDVAVGGLTVGRTYSSRHLNVGGTYGVPIGPSWSLTLGGHQTLVMQPNESMVLTSAGSEAIFAKNGASYESPSGNSNLKLVFQEKAGQKEYVLKDEATATNTTFTQPSKSGTVWLPTIQQGVAPTDTVTYSYETDVYGARPKEALAPVPAGVSCSPELKPGCRALTFVYGGFGSKGENESEWGEFFVHLKEVVFWAYNPITKAMQKTTVAQYAYDSQGRLRAVWDPGVTPALKTRYGYDSEGHVTALTPPGQESWAFTYGTIPSDGSAGRLLKAYRRRRPPLFGPEQLQPILKLRKSQEASR